MIAVLAAVAKKASFIASVSNFVAKNVLGKVDELMKNKFQVTHPHFQLAKIDFLKKAW